MKREQPTPLKHVIESLGVPHTEIGSVTANEAPLSLSGRLSDGDRIEVFPHRLPIFLEDPRFVLDGHLGRLAAYLRMLGFDTWYDRFADDPALASISSSQRRLLLTRDVGLLKRSEVTAGYCVRAHKPHDQLREVSLPLCPSLAVRAVRSLHGLQRRSALDREGRDRRTAAAPYARNEIRIQPLLRLPKDLLARLPSRANAGLDQRVDGVSGRSSMLTSVTEDSEKARSASARQELCPVEQGHRSTTPRAGRLNSTPLQPFTYFQFRVLPSLSHSSVFAIRCCRVSSRLASVIHSMYSRR